MARRRSPRIRRRWAPRTTAPAVVAIVAVLATASCSALRQDEPALAAGQVRDKVRRAITEQLPSTTDIRSIDCPRVAAEPGTRARCEVRLAGVARPARLSLAVGRERILAVELLDAVLDRGLVGAGAQEALARGRRGTYEVDCGTGPVVVRPGGRLRCTASGPALPRPRPITVTVTDPAGTLRVAP